MEKEPFEIHEALRRVRRAVKPYPKAAMFELAEEGFASVFEQVIGCIISVRTRDETTLVCARRLFELARTPQAMLDLDVDEIDRAIRPSTFHEAKAANIREIARRTLEEFGGELPCEAESLTSLRGVGPKCAHLALGVACGKPFISVDIHVHRVTNRWGYVQTKSPERTMAALEENLPKRHWIAINQLLVPFGKHVCTGVAPKCSTCPLLSMCPQIGVTKSR